MSLCQAELGLQALHPIKQADKASIPTKPLSKITVLILFSFHEMLVVLEHVCCSV